MKIRAGFVSNSSTSSFVVCTTLKNHNRAMQNLSLYAQFVVGKVVEFKKIGGMDIVLWGEMDAGDGCEWQYEDINDAFRASGGTIAAGDYGDEMYPREAMDEWDDEVRKCPNDMLRWSSD
jgi:hypothetical protein